MVNETQKDPIVEQARRDAQTPEVTPERSPEKSNLSGGEQSNGPVPA